MRIAHVTLDGNLPRYGIGLAVVRLAQALAAEGDEVRLLCRDECARATAPLPGIRVVPLARRRGLFGGRGAYLRQVRGGLTPPVDVLHVHGVTRMARWLLPSRRRGAAPIVVTCHAFDELGASASAAGDAAPDRARRHARQVDAVLARADAVTAPSRWMAAVVETRAERRDRVHVVPLGPSDVAPASARPHEGFVVLAMARFVRVKGLHLLLEAFATAFGGDSSTRLVIAGDGPEAGALRAKATALGLGARAAFPGYLEGDARRAALAGADVVVVPTAAPYETFGLSALDASASGLPVIVVGAGALVERVEHGEGIAVPLGGADALVEGIARALRRLRGDAETRAAMGRCGRETAASLAWPAVAAAYRRVYETVIRAK